MKGIVRNGPTPTMPMMFVAVACRRPMPRLRGTTTGGKQGIGGWRSGGLAPVDLGQALQARQGSIGRGSGGPGGARTPSPARVAAERDLVLGRRAAVWRHL